MENFNFVDVLKRKRVKLTLKIAAYYGVVQRINPNKTVALTDVVDVKDGRRFPGVKLFFGHEIVNVELCGDTNVSNGETCTAESKGILNVEEFQPYKKDIIYDYDNDDEEEYLNFQVIDEFNEKFGPAMMHIKKQHVIGVAADGVESFQHGRLCWLQIATKSRIYLFDILLLGARAFRNGLSMILQSNRILKVIHDCRGVAGALLQVGVTLTNVFDTQVADVFCFYTETGGSLPDRVSTLQEVVTLYLKVPSSKLSSLKMKMRLTKEERKIWFARPCPLPLMKVMALAVLHLQPLRLVLLDAMMTDLMGRMDSYLGSGHSEPGAVEHITMSSVLELPRELRELENIRKDRQRHALDCFNVTRHGLLDRFNPRPKDPPTTTPLPLSKTLPMTRPPSETPPTTTPSSKTPAMTTALSETTPLTTPLSETLPTAAPLSQTTMTPLCQLPLITLPLSETPPQTTPPGLGARRYPMPRIQADATHSAHHLEPPPITRSILHSGAPPRGPQVSSETFLHSVDPTPTSVAPGPPPTATGPAPPSASSTRPPPPFPSCSGTREIMFRCFRGPLSQSPQAPLPALPALGRGFLPPQDRLRALGVYFNREM